MNNRWVKGEEKMIKKMKKQFMIVALLAGLIMPIMNGNTIQADMGFSDGSEIQKEEENTFSAFDDDSVDVSDAKEEDFFSSEADQDVTQAAGVNEGCELNQYYNIVNLPLVTSGKDHGYHYSSYIPEDGRIKIVLEDCNETGLSEKYFIFTGSVDKEELWYNWWNVGTDTYDSGWITVHEGKISGRLIKGDYGNYNVNREAKIIIKYESKDMYQGEEELNDTYDTANIIQPGITYEGSCARLRDIDIYKFYMEQPGLAVIDVKNLRGGNSTTQPEIYEEDEHENVYLITKATNKKRLRLPAGVYYIKMTTTMQYSLKLDINYESPEEYEQENNNVRSQANEKQINTWYTGNLNTGKDVDFYKFELKKSGNANVELKVPRQSSSNAIVATLYDKDMKELDKVNNTENPYAATEQKKYPAGIYYVTVKSPYSSEFEPDYSISFSQEKYKYVEQIILPDNLKMNTGERYTLNPQILPKNAADPKLIWSTSDSNIATVNTNGVITAKSDGTVIITARASDGSEVESSITVVVETTKKNILDLDITLRNSYKYTGKTIKPYLVIKDGNKTLTEGKDYTLTYDNSGKIGRKFVTITCIGNYMGDADGTYDVVPQDVKINSVKTSGKGKLKISWKKASGIDGYILYRATSQNGDYKRIKVIKNPKTVSYINGSLKNGKKYYYMVDAYKRVDGETFCSLNSKPKGAKTLSGAQTVNITGVYRGNATITIYKSGNNYYAKAYGCGGKMNTTVRLYSYSGGYRAYYSVNGDIFFAISNISSSGAKITFPYVSEFNGWYSK